MTISKIYIPQTGESRKNEHMSKILSPFHVYLIAKIKDHLNQPITIKESEIVIKRLHKYLNPNGLINRVLPTLYWRIQSSSGSFKKMKKKRILPNRFYEAKHYPDNKNRQRHHTKGNKYFILLIYICKDPQNNCKSNSTTHSQESSQGCKNKL